MPFMNFEQFATVNFSLQSINPFFNLFLNKTANVFSWKNKHLIQQKSVSIQSHSNTGNLVHVTVSLVTDTSAMSRITWPPMTCMHTVRTFMIPVFFLRNLTKLALPLPLLLPVSLVSPDTVVVDLQSRVTVYCKLLFVLLI